LRRLAAPIARAVAPGGHVILSGLLAAQAPAAIAAYRMQGLELETSIPLDEWITLMLARRRGNSRGWSNDEGRPPAKATVSRYHTRRGIDDQPRLRHCGVCNGGVGKLSGGRRRSAGGRLDRRCRQGWHRGRNVDQLQDRVGGRAGCNETL